MVISRFAEIMKCLGSQSSPVASSPLNESTANEFVFVSDGAIVPLSSNWNCLCPSSVLLYLKKKKSQWLTDTPRCETIPVAFIQCFTCKYKDGFALSCFTNESACHCKSATKWRCSTDTFVFSKRQLQSLAIGHHEQMFLSSFFF